jgi:hypothetical protein
MFVPTAHPLLAADAACSGGDGRKQAGTGNSFLVSAMPHHQFLQGSIWSAGGESQVRVCV